KKQTEEVIYIDSLKQDLLAQNAEERKEVKVIEIESNDPPPSNKPSTNGSINTITTTTAATNVASTTAGVAGTASTIASATSTTSKDIKIESDVTSNKAEGTISDESSLMANNEITPPSPEKNIEEKPLKETPSETTQSITIDKTYKIPSTESTSTTKTESTSTKMEEKATSLAKLNKIEDASYNKYTSNSNIKTNQAVKHQSQSALFTIQIIALQKPRNASYFIPLEDITVSKGNDGYYRYTIGEYDQIFQAITEMNKLRSIGFDRAFIRNTKHIDNYKIDCEYNHK
ncbi:MAG: hypothetical protein MI922_29310, partial [Bacteroidales bacterium]|nr:hypothetical protein [Bacteroidales bacterium]